MWALLIGFRFWKYVIGAAIVAVALVGVVVWHNGKVEASRRAAFTAGQTATQKLWDKAVADASAARERERREAEKRLAQIEREHIEEQERIQSEMGVLENELEKALAARGRNEHCTVPGRLFDPLRKQGPGN